jgi:hypothetical protein
MCAYGIDVSELFYFWAMKSKTFLNFQNNKKTEYFNEKIKYPERYVKHKNQSAFTSNTFYSNIFYIFNVFFFFLKLLLSNITWIIPLM